MITNLFFRFVTIVDWRVSPGLRSVGFLSLCVSSLHRLLALHCVSQNQDAFQDFMLHAAPVTRQQRQVWFVLFAAHATTVMYVLWSSIRGLTCIASSTVNLKGAGEGWFSPLERKN